MNLDLTGEQTEALTRELSHIIEDDRHPFSPRIRTLKEILVKLRPEASRVIATAPLRAAEQRPIRATTLAAGRPLSRALGRLVLPSAPLVSFLALSPYPLPILPDDGFFRQPSECLEHSPVDG